MKYRSEENIYYINSMARVAFKSILRASDEIWIAARSGPLAAWEKKEGGMLKDGNEVE